MTTMLNKFYEIDFTDGTRTETLRYQICDNPVSRIWLDRVRWHLALPNCHIFDNQWMTTFPTLEKVSAMWRNMKRLVDEANSGQYIKVPYIDMPAEFDPNLDNRTTLNYLHYQFHKFEEELEGKHVGYDPLQELNVEIHRIEAMIDRVGDIENSLLSCGFFLHGDRMQSLDGGDYTVPIEDPEIYKHWNYDDEFGDLVLGYHTVGKNIHHCWIDNDIELVKIGMVRPQRTISNEVVLLFRGGPRVVGGVDGIVKKIHQWVEENDLGQYVDMTQPYNNVAGRPLVGKIVGNYTRNDINEIFELGRVSAVRLIE